MNIIWNTCVPNIWCSLLSVNLDHPNFNNPTGVYVIFINTTDGFRAVRVGQGIIKDRLAKHRLDNDILKYRSYRLSVTWAEVSSENLDGVERYLGDILQPLVGSAFPDVNPIVVNLPW